MHAFGMYLRFISIQIRSQMQYRVAFWMELVSTGLLNGIVFFSLALILERFGTIAGWSLGEIAFLAGMVEASFGLMEILFAGYDPDVFGPFIQQGSFDQLMLRPVNLFWQVLGSRFMLRRLGRMIEGLVILAVGLALHPLDWSLGKALYLPVVFLSQVITMGSLYILSSTLTFWTVQAFEAVNILTYGGVEMMTYPTSIYPAWMQRVFTFIVPFVFLNYAPALYFLDRPDPLNLPAFAPFLSPVVALLLFAASLWFWRYGVDHYQSTGT